MIISRYLIKEILTALMAVTLVLLLLFLSNQLVRYLSYAAAGKIGTSILFQLMGFEIPYLLAILLPLGLYLGIIFAYGRMYSENEMRVLHACGMSVKKLIAITSMLGIVVSLLVVFLTVWVNPWIASQKGTLIARSLSTDNILNSLMPGRFQVSSDGQRVLYVEKVARNHKEANNVFIADQNSKDADEHNSMAWTVVSAGRGSQMLDAKSHDPFIVATDGYRYEGLPGQNDFKVVQFKKYAVRMPHIVMTSKHQEEESLPTLQLLENYKIPENAAELQWRISLPISVLLLGLLAIPLSQTQPRHGRYSQLVPAILIYIIYVNMLFIGRSWVEQKILPIGLGLWWIHLIVFSLGLFLVMLQSGWRFKRAAS